MSSGIFLIGGGWDADALPSMYGPFLDAAGIDPAVACVVLDEGDGAEQFDRWAGVLTAVATCRPVPVLVPLGGRLDAGRLADADALLVCGGLTPAYAAALAPAAREITRWLTDRPYCGFSAGACLAAAEAVVGGWLVDGRPVVPEDAGEDLDEVTIAAGLGLVPFLVDVHAAQWGTLPRLVAACRATGSPGVAIDENTVVSVVGRSVTVGGAGAVHQVVPSGDAVLVRRVPAGSRLVYDSPRGDRVRSGAE